MNDSGAKLGDFDAFDLIGTDSEGTQQMGQTKDRMSRGEGGFALGEFFEDRDLIEELCVFDTEMMGRVGLAEAMESGLGNGLGQRLGKKAVEGGEFEVGVVGPACSGLEWHKMEYEGKPG